MNFAEVLAAAVVLACASSGSLQIWAASAVASRTAEQRQAQLVELDGALLAAAAQLRRPQEAAEPVDCLAAVAWMEAELSAVPLPAGLQRAVEPQDGGVWLRLQGEALPPRQRWLDAAALGLCAAPVPQPEQHSPTDAEPGDGTTI